jgi:hypothetical protein
VKDSGKIKLLVVGAGALLCVLLLAACNYSALDTGVSNADLVKEAIANTKAAKSYHLEIASSGTSGQASHISGDVDIANSRLKAEIGGGDKRRQFVQVGHDTFVSDDGGESFYKDGTDSVSVSMLPGFTGQLDIINLDEVDKAGDALRDGNPAFEAVDGVTTKHIIASNKDAPLLVGGGRQGQQPVVTDTVELWLTLGATPNVRRMKLESPGDESSVTYDWRNLGQPVAVETPKVIQPSNVDLLKKAAADMQAAKSYELDADISTGSDVIKWVALVDALHNRSKMDFVAGSETLSLITIGSDSYTSMDNGKTYIRDDTGGLFTFDLGSFTQMWDSLTTTNLNLARRSLADGNPRTEQIDGVLTRHMTLGASPLTSAMRAGSSGDITSGKLDLWVSTGDTPYVYQLKLDGSDSEYVYTGTLKWSHFNQDLGITAPPANKVIQPTPIPAATAIPQSDIPPRISLADFKALYDDPSTRPLIIDVRSKDLYDAGHIKGAISFPEADVDSRVGELPKDRLIVAYCQ